MRLGKWIVWFMLMPLLAKPALASWSFVQTSDGAATTASGSQAYSSNNTAGNTLIILLFQYGATSASTLNSYSDTIGNSYNHVINAPFQNSSTSKYGSLHVFVASNCKAGANTFNFTFSSAFQYYVVVFEYTGLASYSLDGVTYRFANPTSLSSGNYVESTGELIWAFGENSGTNTTSFTTPSGFTSRKAYSSNGLGTAEYDESAPSSGTTSTTATIGTATGGLFSGALVFRLTNPTLGRTQFASFSTTGAVTFPQPNVSGDLDIVMCRYGTGSTVPSDTCSNTWTVLPMECMADSSNFCTFFYAKNVSSCTPTVTCGGTPNGAAAWEYSGVNTVEPLSGASSFFSNGASISSWATGSVSLPANGVLFSTAANMNIATGNTYTPSSGFQPGVYLNSTDTLQQWDEVVSSGSYSNSITAVAAQNYPQGTILGLSSSTVSYPVLRQHNRASQSTLDASTTVGFYSNVKAGSLIHVEVANQAGQSPGTTSDSASNVYHLIAGGGAAQYGVWWATAASAGSLTVTNTNANCVGISEFDKITTLAQDQTNSATNSSATSLSTGSITTAHANELVVSAGNIINTTSRLYFSSMSAGWNQLVYDCGGHYPSFWLGWQSQAAAGSYSNTFTWTSSASPVTASIASFTTSASAGTAQPSVSIISKSVKPKVFIPGLPMVASMSERALGF